MSSALLFLLLACKKDDASDLVRGSCNPLDETLCALPYPSSFFLKEADTPTGFQVDLADDTLPMNRDGIQLRPLYYNEKDGFSTMGPAMTYFADLSLDGVVGHANIADYSAADAKVVLVDAETGARVPVWAEIDMTADNDDERLMYIWPAVPLEHARRYVIGLRGLAKKSGGEVAVSDGFAALRDDDKTDNDDVEIQRDHYETTVFPALTAAGVPRDELQLAWDFVTVSRENSLGRLEFMRDDMYDRIGPDGPDYVIREGDIVDHDCAVDHIARDIKVTMTVPYYTELPGPNTRLTRDASGMPYYNGDRQVTALVRIPCSLANNPHPGRILQYGHGLLGDYSEAYTGWLSEFADESEYVVVATTWAGMSVEDVPAISLAMVIDPTDFVIVPERCHQGMIEALAGMRLMMGAFATDPAVMYPNADGDMVSVIDPTQRSYYGNSQGGIMGGVYMGMTPDVERGVLGVAGMPYSLLLDRSHDFDPFFALFKAKFTDHRPISLILESFEQLWEPAEGAGWAYSMNRDEQPGIPRHQILIHSGIHDAQVNNLTSQLMARAYGASTVAPQTRPIYGVPEKPSGFTGSAIVEWKYADVTDVEPAENTPPNLDFDTHECPRREPLGQDQIRAFLETGVVEQHCDGACDDSLKSELCPG